jgi:hypothetical protein
MPTPAPHAEILLDLNRAPHRESAARALLAWLSEALRRLRTSGDRADRVRSRVASKLLELSRTGRLSRIEDAERYCLGMVRNALYDLLAEDARHLGERSFDGEEVPTPRAAGLATAEEKEALEESLDAWRARARGLLGRAFAAVLEESLPRYHRGLRETFDDLCALAFDSASLPALLGQRGEAAHPAALDAAYKRHERMRTSLRDAIAGLARAGRLTKVEAAQAEGCLALLLRPGHKKSRPSRRTRSRATTPEPGPTRLADKQRTTPGEPEGALRGAA